MCRVCLRSTVRLQTPRHAALVPIWGRGLIKQIGKHDRRRDADEVREQSARDGVAGFGDFHRAEIKRDDVKRRFGRALHDGRYEGGETVRAVVLDRFQHHGARAVAGQRFHQSGRQGGDEARVDAEACKEFAEAPHNAVKYARITQHRDRRQHRDQIRNDLHGDLKAPFRAFDERFVKVQPFDRTGDQEQSDEKQNQRASERFGIVQARFGRQMIEKRAQAANNSAQPEQISQYRSVENFKLLHKRHGQKTGKRRTRRRQ